VQHTSTYWSCRDVSLNSYGFVLNRHILASDIIEQMEPYLICEKFNVQNIFSIITDKISEPSPVLCMVIMVFLLIT
jgi:hypothetical protein